MERDEVGPDECAARRCASFRSIAGQKAARRVHEREQSRPRPRAPVTAILAMDLEFYEKLPRLFPHNQRPLVVHRQARSETALRNSSLQGAYFIIARAPSASLRTDVGLRRRPSERRVLRRRLKVNFVCSLGHGDASKLFRARRGSISMRLAASLDRRRMEVSCGFDGAIEVIACSDARAPI